MQTSMSRKQIESLVIKDEQFIRLSDSLHRYCPFEALGVVRAEIRHSNFLAYILDPSRPHGFGEAVLRSMLVALSQEMNEVNYLDPLDVHLMDIDDAGVRREWRNIDLLIELPSVKMVVCFELKIGAKQRNGQLKRYREVVSETWQGWKHTFFYLRPTNEVSEDEGWIDIGYELVAEGITKTTKSAVEGSPAEGILHAYLKMLRRNFIMNDELQDLAAKLWRKHGEVLAFLSDNRPDELSSVFQKIIDEQTEFCRDVSSDGAHLIPDVHGGTRSLRFGFNEIDALPEGRSSVGWTSTDRIVLLEVLRTRGKNGHNINAIVTLGPGDSDIREKLFAKVSDTLSKGKSSLSPKWKRLLNEKIIEIKDNFDETDDELIEKVKVALRKVIIEKVSPLIRNLTICDI